MQRMNLTRWLVALLALQVFLGQVSAQDRKPRKKAVARSSENPHWEADVRGEGNTAELAEQVAMVLAKQRLLEHLEGKLGNLKADDIKDDFISTITTKKEPRTPDQEDDPIARGSYAMLLHLEMNAAEYQSLVQIARQAVDRERQQRVQERGYLVGKGLICLVAVFGAFAGYLRMEEATKGYYTAWLRLGAIGFVSAVGAGLWLIS
jgi:hypothetical protein